MVAASCTVLAEHYLSLMQYPALALVKPHVVTSEMLK